jgi:uncharacterized membrane protein YiaA
VVSDLINDEGYFFSGLYCAYISALSSNKMTKNRRKKGVALLVININKQIG